MALTPAEKNEKNLEETIMDCPAYLKPFEATWKTDPHQANLDWFAQADYGMFIHYGLYSMLHNHEWVMLRENIPVKKYETLRDHFTAHNFDADFITDLALECGMKYITLTTCHHESFCLWDSQAEPFNSVNSPCGRDLVKELSEACARKGLGFFAYYTFMLNWRHPYFVPQSLLPCAFDHAGDGSEHLYQKKEDFARYIDYVERCIDELLTNYQVTGIWLDLIMAWYALGEDFIPIERIYENIRRKHPGVLISWKQGATGTEDFASPEHQFFSLENSIREKYGDAAAMRARVPFEKNRHKHNEINSSIQKASWGYSAWAEYRTPEELYALLGDARDHNCNLLLNTSPLADGSLDPIQVDILRKIKQKIDAEGLPGRK